MKRIRRLCRQYLMIESIIFAFDFCRFKRCIQCNNLVSKFLRMIYSSWFEAYFEIRTLANIPKNERMFVLEYYWASTKVETFLQGVGIIYLALK